MKLNIKSIAGGIVAIASLATPLSVAAQNLLTGYFDDNYMYRYQSNPAFANEGNGFFAMPGLGNLNLGTTGTIGVDNFIYNVNGQTTTFLNPGVSAAEVLDGMKDKCRLGVNMRETILALGFKGFKGYNTITLGVRSDIGISLPKDVFRLAKEGISNTTYDLTNIAAQGAAWGEISLGHSHAIGSKLRVGVNLKFLVGIASFNAKVNRGNLQLRDDKWVAQVDATMNGSIKGMYYDTSWNDNTHSRYVDGVNVDDFSAPNGYGAAIDLGAVYTFNRDWEFSASVLDLGFINWSNNVEASTNGLKQVETSDYSFNVDNNDSWDKFSDNLSELYQLENNGDLGSRKSGIGATVNVAAQYTVPVYGKLKVGVLNTTRVNDRFSWNDTRLQATVEPFKCLSLSGSMGMGTFGTSFGCMFNFKASGFNLFLASDRIPAKLAKQGVPLNSNLNFNMGLNFPF